MPGFNSRFMSSMAVAIAATTVLVGCSSSAGDTASNTTSLSGKKIIYIASQITSYVSTSCGAQQVAQQNGMGYSVQYAKTFAASDQIPLVNAAAAQHPDVMLVSPVDPRALIVPLKQAASQGIKVITVGNQLADPSFLTSAVVGSGRQIGETAADELGKLAAGRTGDVAYIGFTPGGSSITDAWQQGFSEAIQRYPNLHALPMNYVTGVDAASGAAAASAVLSAHPDVLGIVGGFNPMANGVAEVLRERNMVGKVIDVQLGADPKAVADLQAGVAQAVIDEKVRDQGAAAVQQAINTVTGKPVTKQVSTAPVVFTKENVADPNVQQYVLRDSC